MTLTEVAEKYTQSYTPYAEGKQWKIEEILRQFSDGFSPSIDCGAGWIHIIYNIHESLLLIYPEYKIVQVKEKFGTLRFYIDKYPDLDSPKFFVVNAIISYGESLSATTCERCGTNAYRTKLRNFYHWQHTYCDYCELKYVAKQISTKSKVSEEELLYNQSILESIQQYENKNH